VPFAVFPDSASFANRVDREARARLKELGIDDPEKVKEILAEHSTLKAENEKKRLADLSELEREREARTKAEAELVNERNARDRAQREARLSKVCAEEGIKNMDYAAFVVEQARAKAEDPAKFDERAVLTALKADPAGAAALGIMSVTTTGATTTTPGKENPPAPGGAPPVGKAVKDMTPTEFREHVTKTTGYTPR